LARQQRADGSWVPLWFGNQDHPAEENPVYGTAKVLLAYADQAGQKIRRRSAASDGFAVLRTSDGSWAGGIGLTDPAGQPAAGSVEETALAVEALLAFSKEPLAEQACQRGLAWLIEKVEPAVTSTLRRSDSTSPNCGTTSSCIR
jgi:squalene-hopene/tetraprenyl-beta-curcumene cyclase